MILFFSLFFLFQTTDHRDIIARAKQETIAAGINPDAGPDECGRWEITRRVALALVGEGAGLLDKPSGNNCQGFAVDIIAYHDGTIVDILGNGSEGPNTPLWIVNPNKVDPNRWRAAPPLENLPPPPPTTEPLPPSPTPEPSPLPSPETVEQKLDAILRELQALRAEERENTEKIQTQINQVVKNAEESVEKATPLILKILSFGIVK